MPERVRCADCGFLTHRNWFTDDLEPVGSTTRTTTKLPLSAADLKEGKKQRDLVPICFVMEPQFIHDNEVYNEPDKAMHLVAKSRDCPSFTCWQPGYSPKEHREMLVAQELKKWQDEQRDRDRAFQEKRLESDRAYQQKMREDERAWQRRQKGHDRLWAFALLILGTTLGYFIKDRSSPPPEPPQVHVHPVIQAPALSPKDTP